MDGGDLLRVDYWIVGLLGVWMSGLSWFSGNWTKQDNELR